VINAAYIGADERLKGRRALLEPAATEGRVLAQFHDGDLGPAYACGWREFGVDEFNLTVAEARVIERERWRLKRMGIDIHETRIAEPTDPDYEEATRSLVDAMAGRRRKA